MKTPFSALVRCVALIYLMSVATTAANAGALLDDPLEKNTHPAKTQTEPMGTAVTGASNTTPIAKNARLFQKLSCWQNGELILEQSVIAPKNKVTDFRLLHNSTGSADMLALDFKNAFCFIK